MNWLEKRKKNHFPSPGQVVLRITTVFFSCDVQNNTTSKKRENRARIVLALM